MINYRTKGNADPRGKRRVYFTCHPEDMERYFDKICNDIFKTHDCAIYYTPDMTEAHDENRDVDLGQMNLFVIPVTFRLLTTPNRAMAEDVVFAKNNNIPILPLMMESSIDEFYSKKENFGELQYLNPYSTDISEISYEEKLKKYLESVLISDEMAKRIRAAFDAYIFLSYRKKDRRCANELMRLIHSRPECRDIAIWYDEFLTPGESFKENIGKMLAESKLFALLVTPNLLEEPDGKPNYVMEHEYPDARKAGIEILPAEMQATDRTELESKYESIPECVDPHDDEAFAGRLEYALAKIAVTANDSDPEHNFLIGLAYLDGIDVEVDILKGIALIESAADADLLEAIEKLCDVYNRYWLFGTSDKMKWQKKCLQRYIQEYGETDLRTLKMMDDVARSYWSLNMLDEALRIAEEVYALRGQYQGDEHEDTVRALSLISKLHRDKGDFQKYFTLANKVLEYKCKLYGENHETFLGQLDEMVFCCERFGENENAIALYERKHAILKRTVGEDDPETIKPLYSMARVSQEIGEYSKACELYEKVYSYGCKTSAHTDTTVYALENIATINFTLGNLDKCMDAVAELESGYAWCCNTKGEDCDEAGCYLICLKYIYGRTWLNDPQKLEELEELFKTHSYKTARRNAGKAYDKRPGKLGTEDEKTIFELKSLASTLKGNKEYEKLLVVQKEKYGLSCTTYGKYDLRSIYNLAEIVSIYQTLGDHNLEKETKKEVYAGINQVLLAPDLEASMGWKFRVIANIYQVMNENDMELRYRKKYYDVICAKYKADFYEGLSVLHKIVELNIKLGDYAQAVEDAKKIYELKCKKYGEYNIETLESLVDIAKAYGLLGDHEKEMDLFDRAYTALLNKTDSTPSEVVSMIKKIASAFEEMEDFEKETQIYEGVYTFLLKTYGEKHEKTLEVMFDIARKYYMLEKYEKAREMYERIFSVQMKYFGEKHPDTHQVLRDLAYLYWKTGEYEKSKELYEKSYNICCSVWSEAHKGAILAMRSLWSVYGELGDDSKAAEMLEKLYTAQLKIFGAEHSDTFETLCNLADTYEKLENYEKEAEVREKIYESSIRIFGDEHSETVYAVKKLTFAYIELEEYQKAAELLEKIYHYSVNSGNTLTAIGSLYKRAYCYSALGEHDKAIELFEKVYALSLNNPDIKPETLMDCLNHLCENYLEADRFAEAAEGFEKIYAYHRETLSEDARDTVKTLCDLAYIYNKLKKYEKEVDLREKIYEYSVRTFGEEHSETVYVMNKLAFVYVKLEEYRKAAELFDKVYHCAVGANETGKALNALHNYAYCCRALGQVDKAIELFEKVYSSKTNDPDTDPVDLMKCLYRLCESYLLTGRYAEAVEGFEKVYVYHRETLGEDHPDTAEVLKNLEAAREKAGQ